MRKKFTYLISLAVAMICSSGGVAWGQTFWDDGCDKAHGNPDYEATCNNHVIIDGDSYFHYVVYGSTVGAKEASVSGSTETKTVSGTMGSCPDMPNPYTTITRYWREGYKTYKGVYERRWTDNCTCVTTGPSGSESTTCTHKWDYYPKSGSREEIGYVPAPSGYGCDWWHVVSGSWIGPNESSHSHNHDPLEVLLDDVQISLDFKAPTYEHDHWDLTQWAYGSGDPTWTKTVDIPKTNVDVGNMKVNSNGLRLNGSGPNQIVDSDISELAAHLIFGTGNTRLLFDDKWGAAWNSGGGTVSSDNWDPLSASDYGTGTLGFYGVQTATISKTGGELLLGPNCLDARTGISTVNSTDAPLTVDSYSKKAIVYNLNCDNKFSTSQNMAYNVAQPEVDNKLNITNSWGGCTSVDFCSAFTPTFSGNGELLINPNVTNFQAGATLNNSTTNTNSNINIYSKKITTTGNFIYTSGTGTSPLHVKISVPQSPACADCGFFYVTGNFTSTNTANGNGSVLIDNEGTRGYVKVDGTYNHTGETTTGRTHTVNVTDYISVGGVTNLTGNKDAILFNSADSWIKFGAAFNYLAGENSLKVYANGAPCVDNTCSVGGKGGYVWIVGPAATTNKAMGTTSIKSEKHYVRMNAGFTHTGIGGNMFVDGETSVDILGGSGVKIKRDSIGNDNILSGSGHIFVENDFEYDQSGADSYGPANGHLTVLANGAPCANFCDTVVDGYVWLKGANLTLTNKGVGSSTIKSSNHYVQIDGKMTYKGEATGTNPNYTETWSGTPQPTLLVSGFTGVDVLGATPKVTMDSVGQASFISEAGHIHFKNAFTFEQTNDYYSNNALDNGLSIIAQGACNTVDCHGRPGYGYVWFEDAVATTTSEHARTEIVSVNHNVIMDKTLTHESKAEGNLHVIARGACDTSCNVAQQILPPLPYTTTTDPPYYKKITQNNLTNYPANTPIDVAPYLSSFVASQQVDFSHSGRGYVHIGDAVKVDMDSIGNATFQSKNDIIQFDKAFSFNKTGSKYGDLYVDGFRGVRSKGAVTTKNPNYITQDVSGSPIAHDDYKRGSDYNTVNDTYRDYLDNDHTPYDGSGNVRYNSEHGFVDFLSTFTHEASQDSSRLDIEGWSRVKFGDDVTITQSNNNDTTLGEAFIYSDNGYVNFMNKLTYTSMDADLRIWAKGPAKLLRSCIDSSYCDGQDGHINFHAPVLIDYTAQTELSPEGRTWIKSFNDDVFIDSTFTYKNTNGSNNGMFWMQAGQDIYGRKIGEKILFTHPGEKSIVWEAQGSIRTKQDLTFDRADAAAGNIVMKAGYKYTGRQGDAVYSHDVKGNSYSNPVNQLVWTQGLGGQSSSNYCPPSNYTHREECVSARGGDIWFQGITDFDLSAVKDMIAPDSTISVLVRAFNSVFVDSTLTYTQIQKDSVGFDDNGQWNDQAGYFRMFAENGNIEAINAPDTKVDLLINEQFNSSEIRLQAGNNPNTGDICGSGAFFCGDKSKWDGNILFNKPLNVTSKGKGLTILSAERDIENQVDAPFNFTYSNDTIMQPSIMTAGRHIETHKMLRFTYPAGQNQLYGQKADIGVSYPNENLRTGNYPGKGRIQILMQAGRLNDAETDCSNKLCKAIEGGTALTEKEHNDGSAQEAYEPNKEYVNQFSDGGAGHGSILAFDSIEFNYDGNGTILMSALNGNIESDPYLHRNNASRTNLADPTPNNGVGYSSQNNIHDAQITFNHGGTGVTRMEAIDIKLHDKLLYDAYQAAADSNGQFYMSAYDSILTRNIKYVNQYDTGSVFITTDKYKNVSPNSDCGAYNCTTGGPGIHQGHIVLGYGADNAADDAVNKSDSIIFDFNSLASNTHTAGANLYIKAGYTGYSLNTITGRVNPNIFKATDSYSSHYADMDRGKAYGGNITFDFMKINMANGNGTLGGYTQISTPNGNIWGKDSLQYHGINGNLLVDAGDGSLEDTLHAVRWSGFPNCNGGGSENTLNTRVPTTCAVPGLWRTGNIIMKGGSLNFNDVSVNGLSAVGASGKGNAIFRTREGFIDTYDAFTVDSMQGDLLKYAGTFDVATEKDNEWGDISERDFEYHPVAPKSGSVFYGADDNIMMNYGYSNYDEGTPSDGYLYGGVGQYDVETRGAGTALAEMFNPYYSTSYMPTGADAVTSGIAYRSVYNVNEDGYMWYRHGTPGKNIWKNGLHLLYRTCHDTPTGDASCSPATGECMTVDNHARDLYFNFDVDAANADIMTGGLGIVAMNYIDMFTKFTYFGGQGTGMGAVPGMTTLHGEGVQGYGLYMKSLSLANGTVNSDVVEQRRATCLLCGESEAYPIGGNGPITTGPLVTHEWTYIGFHDDARIYTQDQKGLIEAPVVEFFGHAELNPYRAAANSASAYGSGELKVKGDSLIFHDSAIFDGPNLSLLPYTTDAAHRTGDMRYGVINDLGTNTKYYRVYGKAITMEDRNTPIIELGYQRCYEPKKAAWNAPNARSMEDKESTPFVGGDIIVAFKHAFSLPIYNTVVANHARISFISDSIDNVDGGEYVDAYIRTDLLRIRNNVEFYTDPTNDKNRRGTLKMMSYERMAGMVEPGIFPHHLHMEPGSELSIPGEDSLVVEMTTTVGGFGNIHEDIKVMQNGTIAPGLSSLMEGDCQTSYYQGKLTIHNLKMEQNAIFRISIGDDNMTCWNEFSQQYNGQCTQTDTLVVEDSIDMREKIYLRVLPKTEHIDEGCYLFLVYGDSTGISKEYVKNLVLDPNSLKYDDKYLGLDFSEPGKVYLCVTGFPMPVIQRYVTLPSVTGVTTTPNAGTHYVAGNQNFSFTASYAGAPLKVTAEGYYSHEVRELDYTAVVQPDGSYLYTIYQVVEPWEVKIGPEASTVGNEAIDGQRVWAYKNTLHINVDKSDIVSIYNLTGVLYKKIEVPEGNSKFTLDRGMYVVTLKDGSVYKIVIK